MKNIIFITLITLSNLSYGCGKIVEGYESSDIMYSICPNFAELPNDSASKLVHVLLSQYTGPPDERLIYFVSSSEGVGKNDFEPGELIGYYYSHSHKIVVWPDTPKEKVIKLTWQ